MLDTHTPLKPIWIVDDDQSIRFVLERALAREHLQTRLFSNPREVLAALEDDTPQVLISDIRMPGGSGIDLLAQVRERCPDLPVIIMTAFSDLDSAVQAFQGGAFEYLAKPFDVPKAVELIRRAMREGERDSVVAASVQQDTEMLGQAAAMQDVFRAIGRLSQSHVTVLITGESGTGKELVARALHRHSPRGDQGSRGPFVAINTAAIPKDLLESELFGHERGAFTGAQAMRRGRFEQADGGTLFLDEIGDMPLDLQTRLLRVLSDGQFYRVGGHQALRANVRVIAATHQNLEERVRQGAFREDLFHRLNVIRLRLPALRERSEDIGLLVRHFLSKSAKDLGIEAKRITDQALQRLQSFDFPGNVRQLENICHWLTVMAPAQVIEPKDLPPELLGLATHAESITPTEPVGLSASARMYPPGEGELAEPLNPPPPAVDTAAAADAHSPGMMEAPTWVNDLERQARELLESGQPDVWDTLSRTFESRVITAALSVTRGRRIEAAQKLGIGRNTITRKIQELKLDA